MHPGEPAIDADARAGRRFTVSHAELLRRRSAFDRLGVATVVSATLAAADLVLRGLPASLAGVAVLVLAFLAARAGLARSFRRFARTVWTVSPGTLRRTDARSDVAYPLAAVRSVRTKSTTSGVIREMRIGFDGGRTVYVNALGEIDALRSLLVEGAPASLRHIEVREAVDFDAPWFYAAFGTLLGVAIALAVRFATAPSGPDVRLVYGTLAVYSLGLGAYWLHAKPLTGRFGQASVVADRVAGGLMVCAGLAGVAAVLLARPL